MKQFRRKYDSEKCEGGKPIMLIVWPELLMSVYASEFQKVLSNYQNVFEIYYCKNGEEISDIFDTSDLPKENARVFITNSEQNKKSNFQGIIDNFQNPDQELTDFIENFIDGELEEYVHKKEP